MFERTDVLVQVSEHACDIYTHKAGRLITAYANYVNNPLMFSAIYITITICLYTASYFHCNLLANCDYVIFFLRNKTVTTRFLRRLLCDMRLGAGVTWPGNVWYNPCNNRMQYLLLWHDINTKVVFTSLWKIMVFGEGMGTISTKYANL